MNSKLHGSTKSVKSISSVFGEKFFEMEKVWCIKHWLLVKFIGSKTLKKSGGKDGFHGFPGDMNV